MQAILQFFPFSRHSMYNNCSNESLFLTESVSDLKFYSSFLRNLHQSNNNIASQKIAYEMVKHIHMSQYNNQKTVTLHRIVCPLTIPVMMMS